MPLGLNSGSGGDSASASLHRKTSLDSAVTHRCVLPTFARMPTGGPTCALPWPLGSGQHSPRPTLHRSGGLRPRGAPFHLPGPSWFLSWLLPCTVQGVLNPLPPAVRGPANTHVLGAMPPFLHGARREVGVGHGQARGVTGADLRCSPCP